MVELLIQGAAINCFILILCIKWKIVDYYQFYRPSWAPNSCNFCAFFWFTCIRFAVLKITRIYPVAVGVDTVLNVVCITIFSLIVWKFLNHADFNKR